MANGDAAAAAGFTPVPPTKDKRLGYDDINRLADWVALHMTNGTHPFNKVTGQLATAQIANAAVTNPKIANDAVTDLKIGAGEVKTRGLADGNVNGAKLADTITKPGSFILEGSPLSIRGSVARLTVGANAVLEGGTISLTGATSSLVLGPNTILDGGSSITLNADSSLFLEPDGYVTSTRTYSNTSSGSANVYIDGNGRLFRSTSSRRYKDEIEDAPESNELLRVRPRTWKDKNRGKGDERRHFGVIAEELHELGLTHLVSYVDGEPEAVAYDRIAVALIPALRRQAVVVNNLRDRVEALEARLTALESPTGVPAPVAPESPSNAPSNASKEV